MNVATIITEILTFPKKIWERSPPWGKILIVAVGLLLIMTLSLLPIISAEKRWRSDGLTGEEIFAESWKSTVSFLDFWVKDSNGVEVKLKDVYYDDVPTLVVFAASPNLIQKNTDKVCNPRVPKDKADLLVEKKYSPYNILLFPCNDFTTGEPGLTLKKAKEAMNDCNPKLLLFENVEVHGKNQHYIWKWLTNKNKSTAYNLDRVEFYLDKTGEHVTSRVNVSTESAIDEYLIKSTTVSVLM